MRRLGFTIWLGLLATACVPSTAAYVSVPIEVSDARSRDAAVVRVPLAELEPRLSGFDASALAFFGPGREPLPHRLIDTDGDGAMDHAVTILPVAGDGTSRLVVVCPGPVAQGDVANLEPTDGITLRFDRAYR